MNGGGDGDIGHPVKRVVPDVLCNGNDDGACNSGKASMHSKDFMQTA